MNIKGNTLIAAGIIMITGAIGLESKNIEENIRASQASQQVMEVMEKETVPPDAGLITEPNETPVRKINGENYLGILRIPALELELPVILEWSEARLKTAPCRYYGSADSDNLILMAHNYQSHFGKIKKLVAGEQVSFTDMEGKLYLYQVTEITVLKPESREELLKGDWDLALFTCTGDGKARVVVRCQKG